MSANRSVQAAQRRRAGPTNDQNNSGRGGRGGGPQPSIGSSHMFTIQPPKMDPVEPEKLSSVNKMTVPQAITLITLRLGMLETKLAELGEDGGASSVNLQTITDRIDSLENQSTENSSDVELFQSIMTRLENIEKQLTTSPTELKSVETLKQSVVQIKNTFTKENMALKLNIESLKNDLNETKKTVSQLMSTPHEVNDELLDGSLDGCLDDNLYVNA